MSKGVKPQKQISAQKVFKPVGKIAILVDDREAETEVVKELEHFDCLLKIMRLTVADFLLSDRVAVEKKTFDDFIQSMVDGRLFQQIAALCDNYERPLMIVEGTQLFQPRALHPNALRGALAAISVDFRVPILWTDDAGETAALLFTIAKREQEEKNRSLAIRSKKKKWPLARQQEFLIAGLPAVSTMTAKRLLKHFKTPERIFSAGEKELQEVEKIGKEKANKIKQILESEYDG